jgi:hypothetical protein
LLRPMGQDGPQPVQGLSAQAFSFRIIETGHAFATSGRPRARVKLSNSR